MKESNSKPQAPMPAPRCQWMAGAMGAETSSWKHCSHDATAEVFRTGISVGVVCEFHARTAKLFGWDTRPMRR